MSDIAELGNGTATRAYPWRVGQNAGRLQSPLPRPELRTHHDHLHGDLPVTAPTHPFALVTGANRGLGREVAVQLAQRGHRVWASARSEAKARKAAEGIAGAEPLVLDVADADSVAAAFDTIARHGAGLAVVVNNAGIDYDTDQRAATADLARVRRIFDTNVFGPWRVAQHAAPLLARQAHSVIVNVSSGAGAMTAGAGAPGYSASKAALNRLTLSLAGDLATQNTLVNAVCPGWVATDMGGGGRPVPEGAKGIVWAATLGPDGPTGGFFRDGREIPW